MPVLCQKRVSWTANLHGDSVSVWMSRWCNYTSKYCFLSRANLREYEVILQRAGLDCLSHEEVKTLRVCARHRYGMDKYWRPSKLCQYPGHKGPPTSIKSRDVINPAMAKEVFQLFDISVPIGSRKNKTHNFLIGYFWLLFFYLPLAICSPCRKKHKADTNSTLFTLEEECTKTHAAEKTYKSRYA